ncbi:MAG TPA: hypothetical protein VI007_01365 [bacterium]
MNYRRAVLYALGVWIIPFVVAIAIFPLRANERPLFESIMPIAVVGATVIFAIGYARSESAFAGTGLLLGVIFLAVSVVLDLLLFSWGPMKMSLVDYLKDIGLTYLIMPIVTYGMSRVAPRQR